MAVGAVAVVGIGPEAWALLERVVAAGIPVRFEALLGGPAARESLAAHLRGAAGADRDAADALLAQICFDDGELALDECDLVVEAERVGLHDKVRWLRALEARMAPGAVLAACSATLPMHRVAGRLARPEQFLAFAVGGREPRRAELHVTPRTAPGATESVRIFLRAIGLTPIEVPPAGPISARDAAPDAWRHGEGRHG